MLPDNKVLKIYDVNHIALLEETELPQGDSIEKVTATNGVGIKVTLVINSSNDGDDDLILESLSFDHKLYFNSLFSNVQARLTYGNGYPATEKQLSDFFNLWERRWKVGNPYSAFSIFRFNKETVSKDYVGNVVLGADNKIAGEAIFSIILHPDYWRHHIGTRVSEAILGFYASSVLPIFDPKGLFTKGQPLCAIQATSWVDTPSTLNFDNPKAMRDILRNLDFAQASDVNNEKYKTPSGIEIIVPKYVFRKHITYQHDCRVELLTHNEAVVLLNDLEIHSSPGLKK